MERPCCRADTSPRRRQLLDVERQGCGRQAELTADLARGKARGPCSTSKRKTTEGGFPGPAQPRHARRTMFPYFQNNGNMSSYVKSFSPVFWLCRQRQQQPGYAGQRNDGPQDDRQGAAARRRWKEIRIAQFRRKETRRHRNDLGLAAIGGKPRCVLALGDDGKVAPGAARRAAAARAARPAPRCLRRASSLERRELTRTRSRRAAATDRLPISSNAAAGNMRVPSSLR